MVIDGEHMCSPLHYRLPDTAQQHQTHHGYSLISTDTSRITSDERGQGAVCSLLKSERSMIRDVAATRERNRFLTSGVGNRDFFDSMLAYKKHTGVVGRPHSKHSTGPILYCTHRSGTCETSTLSRAHFFM